MTFQRLAPLILALAMTAASSAAAQEPWTGRSVLYTKPPKDIGFVDQIEGKQTVLTFSGNIRIVVREEVNGRLRIHDGRREGWVEKADFAVDRGAVDHFDRAVRADPDDGWSRRMRGAAWLMSNKTDRAIEDFDECIRRDPKDAASFVYRGIARRRARDFDKAIEDFDEAIRLDAKNAAALHERGYTFLFQSEFEKAMRDYDAAIAIDPEDINPILGRARLWQVWKKDYDKAIEDFDVVLRIDPQDHVTFVSRGFAWHEKKDCDKALRDFEEAQRIEPEWGVPHQGIARVWVTKREYAKALRSFDEAVRLDPKDGASFNNRAWIWATCPDARIRNGAKAVASAERALELDPDSPHAMDTLAASHAEAGNFDRAVEWMEKALMHPDFRDNADFQARLELFRKKEAFRQK